MCAIVGIHTNKKNVCLSLYNALTVLQHRGQDAAGMSTFGNKSHLKIHKSNGLVRDVFSNSIMEKMMGGTYGIGHTRYPTAGQIDHDEAQPFYVNSPFGIVLVHNGNLVNAVSLRNQVQEMGFDSITDLSMGMSNDFAKAIQFGATYLRVGSAIFGNRS